MKYTPEELLRHQSEDVSALHLALCELLDERDELRELLATAQHDREQDRQITEAANWLEVAALNIGRAQRFLESK